jgi:hypothetical protein
MPPACERDSRPEPHLRVIGLVWCGSPVDKTSGSADEAGEAADKVAAGAEDANHRSDQPCRWGEDGNAT